MALLHNGEPNPAREASGAGGRLFEAHRVTRIIYHGVYPSVDVLSMPIPTTPRNIFLRIRCIFFLACPPDGNLARAGRARPVFAWHVDAPFSMR
jgi:hypothetical protein